MQRVTIPSRQCASVCFKKLKVEAKAADLGNGLHEKLRCWPNNTRQRAEAISNALEKKPEVIEKMDQTKMENSQRKKIKRDGRGIRPCPNNFRSEVNQERPCQISKGQSKKTCSNEERQTACTARASQR